MPSSYQLLIDGSPAKARLYDTLSLLEVEENLDLPGAIQLELPVAQTNAGDLQFVGDEMFKPFAGISVIAQLENGPAECIFDGYILSSKLHVDAGITASTLQIWGQDAEWLMNLEEKTREWADVTDSDVANQIYSEYGIDPASDNSADDSPAHTENTNTLMQRGSDIQFLRRLARSNGKFCRIACRDDPKRRIGYFSAPSLDDSPVTAISLADSGAGTVDRLDVSWEVSRPSGVRARQALFTDDSEDGIGVETEESALTLLDKRGLGDFSGRAMTVLMNAPVADAGELSLRANALLRESGWFVRCEGVAEASRLSLILRTGTIVELNGIGALNSGKYLVWSVRHSLTPTAHTMSFVLARNAVGPAASGSSLGV